MQPWQRAKQWLERWPDAVTFEELLGSCIQNGFVYSSDVSFYLVQRCYWDGFKPFFLTDRHNGWFVHLASGSIKDMFLKAPHALEHIVFQRHGLDKYHAYNFNKMKEKYGI
jgi:hypothetical protein